MKMVSDSNFPSPPQVFCQMVLVKSKSDFYLVAIKLLGIFLSSVGPRQHGPDYPGSPAPMLASTSRKAFPLRRATPTPKSKEPKSMQYKTRG